MAIKLFGNTIKPVRYAKQDARAILFQWGKSGNLSSGSCSTDGAQANVVWLDGKAIILVLKRTAEGA